MTPTNYEKLGKAKLTELAKGLGIKGYSRMNKTQLVEAIHRLESKVETTERKRKQTPTPKKAGARKQPPAAKRGPAEAGVKGKAQPVKKMEAARVGRQPELEPPPIREAVAIEEEQAAVPEPEVDYEDFGEFSSEELRSVDDEIPDLPESYGDNKVVLMPRDPQWLYAYWDVAEDVKEDARSRGGRFLTLRLYDVTDVTFDGTNAHSVHEHSCLEWARWWYLPVPAVGRSYCVALGYVTEEGSWMEMLRSNVVQAPVDRPSGLVRDVFVTMPADQWPAPEVLRHPDIRPTDVGGQPGIHEELYQYAGGQAVSSGGASPGGSWMMGSGHGSSPKLWARAEGEFGLWANAELVIYGGTEPDAKVVVGGQPVALREDGSFTVRFALSNGDLKVPVEAERADGSEKCIVNIELQRQTDRE